jgi:hypothetical protein
MKKVFVTHKATTMGIREGELVHQDPKGVATIGFSGDPQFHEFSRSDWHLTRDEAVTRANKMRANRMDYLTRQMAEMESLTFA